MRLTFPAFPLNKPVDYCAQLALACIPITVAFVAEQLFGHTKQIQNAPHCMRGLGIASLLILRENKWACSGGIALWILFEAYRYYNPFTVAHVNQVKEIKPIYRKEEKSEWTTQNILKVAPALMDHIEKQGIDEEGIYRVPGEDRSTKKLLLGLDGLLSTTSSSTQEIPVNQILRLIQTQHVNTIATVVKGLFKRLKVPLLQPIAEQLFEISANKDHPDKNRAFHEALSTLPPHEQELGHHTILHLGRIAQNSAKNRMTSQSLATIFIASFFVITESDFLASQVKVLTYASALIDLIENYRE